ncbi:50S ribosomal protein L10-like [Dreissena polymorpha]|uniref:Large ribosomal subunit protein uL10m n=1 Tax=Dreissena polymorpha TaxID=45954 RepID=A0A9D4DGB2_DREPO|nr:50S ribosomal protein L10-like [Dreissena polymorpha]KAH3748020.1 hypothetical protein DPMN_182457 [Dreissena polymorpha]
MAATICRSFAKKGHVGVLVSQVRFKFKTQRPRQQPVEQRVFKEITEPLYPDRQESPRSSCNDKHLQSLREVQQSQDQAGNIQARYEAFLLKQLRNLLETSGTILLCHQMPCTALRLNEIKVDLKLAGLKLSRVSNTQMRQLIKGTKLENLGNLLYSHTLMITSPKVVILEPMNILKKATELPLLGGFVGDRLVTKDMMIEYCNMPSLDQLLAELVASLNQVGGAKTLRLLSHHQEQLATNLQQYQSERSKSSS